MLGRCLRGWISEEVGGMRFCVGVDDAFRVWLLLHVWEICRLRKWDACLIRTES